MRTGCSGCPYTDFMYFYNYYGVDDYAHQFVEAAFEGSDTRFMNGNVDFSTYGLVGREEAVEGGTVMLHIFMRVIRQLEDALDDCERGDSDSVRAWDEGVVSRSSRGDALPHRDPSSAYIVHVAVPSSRITSHSRNAHFCSATTPAPSRGGTASPTAGSCTSSPTSGASTSRRAARRGPT